MEYVCGTLLWLPLNSPSPVRYVLCRMASLLQVDEGRSVLNRPSKSSFFHHRRSSHTVQPTEHRDIDAAGNRTAVSIVP